MPFSVFAAADVSPLSVALGPNWPVSGPRLLLLPVTGSHGPERGIGGMQAWMVSQFRSGVIRRQTAEQYARLSSVVVCLTAINAFV